MMCTYMRSSRVKHEFNVLSTKDQLHNFESSNQQKALDAVPIYAFEFVQFDRPGKSRYNEIKELYCHY